MVTKNDKEKGACWGKVEDCESTYSSLLSLQLCTNKMRGIQLCKIILNISFMT